MLSLKKKRIYRNSIPQNKDSLWLYDNYEKIIDNIKIDPSLVTEAIYEEDKRRIVLKIIKK